MTSTPEIPDSISPERLSRLLRNRNPLPASDLIPELDFGGDMGAPCDLQFSIAQLIERSNTGTNIIQMLVASMHLLTEVESHLDRHLQQVLIEDEPYADLPARDQKALAALMRSHLLNLRASLHQLEDTLAQVGYPYYYARARDLVKSKFSVEDHNLREFRSHMLISDELLRSLNVDRDAVTQYLDYITENNPTHPTA